MGTKTPLWTPRARMAPRLHTSDAAAAASPLPSAERAFRQRLVSFDRPGQFEAMRFRGVAAKATITEAFLFSLVAAGGLLAARPGAARADELEALQGTWRSVRDGVEEMPTVTGNLVRWGASGRVDPITKRPISRYYELNGWKLDLHDSSQQQQQQQQLQWTKEDQTLTWIREEDDSLEVRGEVQQQQQAGLQANFDGDFESQWSRGKVAATPWKHIPSPAPPQAQKGDKEFLIEVGAPPAFRRFRFSRALPQPPLAAQPSRLFVVQIPRPIGVGFEMDRDSGAVTVAEILKNGNADRQRKLSAFIGEGDAGDCVRQGDVLRAFSTTTFEYGTLGLLGAEKPKKSRTLFGIPSGEKGAASAWGDIASAFKSDRVHGENDVTLVLERRLAPAGTPGEDGYDST